MMTRELLASLYRHAAWANREVLSALRATPGTDPRALEQFAHVLGAEHVWLSRIRGETARFAVWPALTLDECAALAAENESRFDSILNSANDGGDLERVIRYVNSAGQAFTNRLVDLLVHVAMHGSYHRGMVSQRTRDGGGSPAPTDFIAFIRGAPTATRQDAR
jgi:uncharacterized damage-inducible protein DinB